MSNGTWLLATRYGSGSGKSHLTLATARSWEGPYTVVSYWKQWAAGVATEGSEDPFVWENRRGFHMVHHDGPHGRHVWSADGLEWGESATTRSFDHSSSLLWNSLLEPYLSADSKRLQFADGYQEPSQAHHGTATDACVCNGSPLFVCLFGCDFSCVTSDQA